MGKILRRLIFRLIFVIVVLGLGYLGFIPGVSAMFGSNKPVDLGLPISVSDQASANKKFHQTVFNANEPRALSPLSIIRSGSSQIIGTALSPEETAAHLMQMHPFTDLQIRFNADNTFEAAGKIDTPRVSHYLKTLELTNVKGVDILKTIDRFMTGRPTIYVKGSGSINDEKVTLQLQSAKIGRLSLAPLQFGQGLKAYVEAVMRHVPGLEVEDIHIEQQQVKFLGQAPSVVPQY